MKNFTSLFILTSTVLLLTACNTENKNSKQKPTIETKNPKNIESKEKKTSDLKAPSDMNFVSHSKIKTFTDITNQGGGPAYLSIYSDYSFVSSNINSINNYDSWKTNQNSRVLASSIIKNKIENQFAIPQHISRLLVQVWFYDGRPPLIKEVDIKKEIFLTWE